MRRFALAITLCLAAGATAQADEGEATAFAQAFCGLRDLEDGAGRIHLASPALAEAVTAALAARTGGAADGGPLADGVPWQSVAARAPQCAAGAVSAEDGTTVVEVRYAFPDASGEDWVDRLVLVRHDGALVVDDVRYGATGNADTLRGRLVAGGS